MSNSTLTAQGRRKDCVNPTPQDRYNLVVIGGGTAGITAATGAAELGARVALVERHLLGGSRVHIGCVPAQALRRCARAAWEARHAGEHGVRIDGIAVEFPAVMEYVRAQRERCSAADDIEKLKSKGIDVFLGEARFVDGKTIEVNGAELKFARAVIATGARTVPPPIPGLAEANWLTAETLLSLSALPGRLAVFGAGSTGLESAQAFARLGSRVVVYETAQSVLPSEDPDAAQLVRRSLESDGVTIQTGIAATNIENAGSGSRIRVRIDNQEHVDEYDCVLVATGRTPDLSSLNLAAAGVEQDQDGVIVDDRLRTTNSRIFACGDAASKYKYTHAADALARIVIGNALFFAAHRASELTIPWAVHTDPELAHVGVYGHLPEGKYLETMTLRFGESVEYPTTESTESLIKIHHDHRGVIHGATIVSPNAGELIGEIVMAINHKVKLGSLASDIHPYPAQSEIIKRCGDAYRRTMLTPIISRFIKKLMDTRR